jgi:hypothetical protein
VGELRLGPDSARYMLAAQGHGVARPFNLRVLLPAVCGDDPRMWWGVWLLSWPVAAAGMAWWAFESGLVWQQMLAAPILLLALAGVWAPHVCRPVSVDLPAMAVSIVAVAALEAGWWPLAVVLAVIAGSIKESSPVWAALWAWHPILLVGLVVPLVIGVWRRPTLDEVTQMPVLRRVHDHPVRSAWEHHAGKWRDPRMVAQWGGCLAAFYSPSLRVAVVTAVAHAQLIVATDTYRLIHTAAGPFLAVAAVQVIPVPWLALACAVSCVWWLKPEFQ